MHYARWRAHGDPLRRIGTPYGEPLAFFEAAMESETDDCIDWPFAGDYGRLRIDGKDRSVHVLACERAHGPRPEGLQAAHSCGRGAEGCFNPRHLRWATQAENEADKRGHGTRSAGERHGAAKLTAAAVAEIRARYGAGEGSQRALGRGYGVSQRAIWQIVNNVRWI
jgi:hypothetical protein